MKNSVLVVDDDVYNLSVAKKLMEDSYEVIGVSGGESCLKVLSRRMPSLILLDIDMPNMNGYEVMDKIRENKQWAELPVIFLTANTDVKTEQKCLEMGAVDFIRKPFEPTVMLSRVDRSIQLYSLSHHLQDVIDEKTNELERLNFRFTKELVDIVEGRDNDTGDHVQRTCGYVKMIVKKLYEKKLFTDVITETSAEKIERAAALHDIGKIKISDVVLNKPGRLTVEEFKTMQNHVVYGGEMIDKLLKDYNDDEYYHIARNIVTCHHEKWDGSGYSLGLSGDDIPAEARIMAVADVFDALVSKRCYKNAMPVEDAFEIIKESSGNHFDPVVAETFLELKEEIIDKLSGK